MVFITGGNSQGKLEFVKSALGIKEEEIADGGICGFNEAFQKQVLDKLHLLVGRMLSQGLDAQAEVIKGVEENPNIIVICDETGCGIVPIEARERILREQVGRLACNLARKAQKVYRVSCGIPVLIKGEVK